MLYYTLINSQSQVSDPGFKGPHVYKFSVFQDKKKMIELLD